MEYSIKDKDINLITEDITNLSKFFDDRVKECYDVKGMQVERHSFILYRKLLWEIQEKLVSSVKEIKSK